MGGKNPSFKTPSDPVQLPLGLHPKLLSGPRGNLTNGSRIAYLLYENWLIFFHRMAVGPPNGPLPLFIFFYSLLSILNFQFFISYLFLNSPFGLCTALPRSSPLLSRQKVFRHSQREPPLPLALDKARVPPAWLRYLSYPGNNSYTSELAPGSHSEWFSSQLGGYY